MRVGALPRTTPAGAEAKTTGRGSARGVDFRAPPLTCGDLPFGKSFASWRFDMRGQWRTVPTST